MAYNYVATAQPPTAVTHSLVGNFTAADDVNLIVAESTRIELFKLTPQGLQPVTTFNLYGRISVMKLVRMPGESQDCLFISTERYHFVTLEWDSATDEIKTRANGDIKDKIGRARECGHIGIVDPSTRLVGLHLYDGLLKIIPVEADGMKEAFNIRLEELDVIDLALLYGCAQPTLLGAPAAQPRPPMPLSPSPRGQSTHTTIARGAAAAC